MKNMLANQRKPKKPDSGENVLLSCHFYVWNTVGTESIQTPLNFSLFVILQPFAKII